MTGTSVDTSDEISGEEVEESGDENDFGVSLNWCFSGFSPGRGP